MKVFVPFRRVDAPELSEGQVSKLIHGRYVEGDFGLDEGDVFLLTSIEVMCYRIMDSGGQRLRVLSDSERELSQTSYPILGDTFQETGTWC